MSVKDVDSRELIISTAEELKKTSGITPPVWAPFVKTGSHKERVPDNADWWYMRAAALLRRVAITNAGVSRLRRVYGGRKHRGYKPEKKVQASGNIIRKILQQLEAAKLVKKGKKGRQVTAAGQKFLDKVAKNVSSHQK
ncbi:30S ribosomal protein S19e [uncultured archaeon]|nr:30S ribosomal protein S19e [uncultured archaeon]